MNAHYPASFWRDARARHIADLESSERYHRWAATECARHAAILVRAGDWVAGGRAYGRALRASDLAEDYARKVRAAKEG